MNKEKDYEIKVKYIKSIKFKVAAKSKKDAIYKTRRLMDYLPLSTEDKIYEKHERKYNARKIN